MTEKKKYSIKCLEQKCETRACHIRPTVNVTLSDLGRWTSQNYVTQILPGLSLRFPEAEGQTITIEAARIALESDPEQTACIFYHEESNACKIRFSRPVSCMTYPLEYDGAKFVVSDKNCPGVGQGEITKDSLRESKELAEQEYRERLETVTALPGIYSLIVGQMMQQSADAMKDLSEEDRQRLDEIMSKKSNGKDETEDSSED